MTMSYRQHALARTVDPTYVTDEQVNAAFDEDDPHFLDKVKQERARFELVLRNRVALYLEKTGGHFITYRDSDFFPLKPPVGAEGGGGISGIGMWDNKSHNELLRDVGNVVRVDRMGRNRQLKNLLQDGGYFGPSSWLAEASGAGFGDEENANVGENESGQLKGDELRSPDANSRNNNRPETENQAHRRRRQQELERNPKHAGTRKIRAPVRGTLMQKFAQIKEWRDAPLVKIILEDLWDTSAQQCSWRIVDNAPEGREQTTSFEWKGNNSDDSDDIAFAEKWKQSKLKHPTLGGQPSQPEPRGATSGRYFVSSVVKGSFFHQAGIRSGFELLAVNGISPGDANLPLPALLIQRPCVLLFITSREILVGSKGLRLPVHSMRRKFTATTRAQVQLNQAQQSVTDADIKLHVKNKLLLDAIGVAMREQNAENVRAVQIASVEAQRAKEADDKARALVQGIVDANAGARLRIAEFDVADPELVYAFLEKAVEGDVPAIEMRHWNEHLAREAVEVVEMKVRTPSEGSGGGGGGNEGLQRNQKK